MICGCGGCFPSAESVLFLIFLQIKKMPVVIFCFYSLAKGREQGAVNSHYSPCNHFGMVDNSSLALQCRSTMDRNFWPYMKPKQMDFAQKCTTGSGGSGKESPVASFPARNTHRDTHVCAHKAWDGGVVPVLLKGSREGSWEWIHATLRQQELVRSHWG